MIGRVVAVCTRAINWDEAPSEVISQAAPTVWIKPPKLEARLAIQIERKMPDPHGEAGGAEAGEGAERSGVSVAPTTLEEARESGLQAVGERRLIVRRDLGAGARHGHCAEQTVVRVQHRNRERVGMRRGFTPADEIAL